MKSVIRRFLRFYLAQCPVTEGKGALYRSFAKRLLPAERLAVTSLPFGFMMELDLEETGQREIYFFLSYERKESALIRLMLQPGDVFWDVGASIGYYTLMAAARVGESGRVIAFEPFPPALERIERNISLNPFKNIRVVRAASGSSAGTVRIYFDRDIPDGVATLAPTSSQTSSIQCEQLSLDHFLNSSGERPPNILKADIEGAETSMLKGASLILQSANPPILLLEMEEEQFARHNTSKREIHEILSPRGYIPFELKGRRWFRCPDVCSARNRNILWIIPSLDAHRARARQAGVF